jgi:peroxiredoxin Q/BCP
MSLTTIPSAKALAEDGRDVTLTDVAKGKALVVFFYPKDNTPICTKEACTFRDNYSEFAESNAEIVGVSSDSQDSHIGFKSKHSLPFPLLSDESGALRKAFGLKNFLGFHPPRETFVFSKDGTLLKHIKGQFRSEIHVAAALECLKLQN